MGEASGPVPNLAHIDQMGFVVPDLDDAVRHWLDVYNVGPWFVLRDVEIFGAYDDDEPAAIGMSVAFSYIGDNQIELIEPRGSGPSPYRSFAEQHGGGGLHHLAVFSDDFEADFQRLRRGRPSDERVFRAAAGPMELAYFEGNPGGGPVLELLGAATSRPMFDFIFDGVRNWDGSDPVREMPLAPPAE